MRSRNLLILLVVLALGALPVAAKQKGIPGIRERVREVLSLGQASIRTDVHPKDAQVYLDGALVGTVRDYNGKNDRLFIFPGTHTLEFRHPDYQTYTTQLSVMPDQDLRVRARMKRIR